MQLHHRPLHIRGRARGPVHDGRRLLGQRVEAGALARVHLPEEANDRPGHGRGGRGGGGEGERAATAAPWLHVWWRTVCVVWIQWLVKVKVSGWSIDAR